MIDYEAREQAIFGEPYDEKNYDGFGVRHFHNLHVKILERMVKEGWANLESSYNHAPTIGEYIDFLHWHPLIRAHGYVGGKNHEDIATTIEGLEYNSIVTMEMLIDFVQKYKNADKFEAGIRKLYCRYEPIASQPE